VTSTGDRVGDTLNIRCKRDRQKRTEKKNYSGMSRLPSHRQFPGDATPEDCVRIRITFARARGARGEIFAMRDRRGSACVTSAWWRKQSRRARARVKSFNIRIKKKCANDYLLIQGSPLSVFTRGLNCIDRAESLSFLPLSYPLALLLFLYLSFCVY